MGLGVGSVLGGGKYRLDVVIGKGGMGEVFAATHVPTASEVAIKIVNRSMVGEILLQRLHREAVAARRVQSEFVPRLIDVDHSDDGELFLVMERLHGETLSERLKRKRALSWQEVNELTHDLLCGLIDAHAAGVVHRDLKPGNVFLENAQPGGRERAKILDFGVCKIDAGESEHLTTTGEALGTIAYMAPEQIRGANKVDERADIYSLGMVIFEMLSGRLAYDVTGQVALIAAKLEHKADAVRDHALVAVPAGLDTLLSKALARKSQDRFTTAQEMLRAWRGLGPPTIAPKTQPSRSSGQLPSSTDSVMTAGTFEPETAASIRRWSLAVGLFVMVASLGIFMSLKYLRRAPQVDAAAESATETAPAIAASNANATDPDPATPTPTSSPNPNPNLTPQTPPDDLEVSAAPTPTTTTTVAPAAPPRFVQKRPPPPPPKASATAPRKPATPPGKVEKDAKF